MRSNNKKEQILEAALQVVEENGANHLTIDAVAACQFFQRRRLVSLPFKESPVKRHG